MKKINVKSLVITSIVCLLPIILGLIFYNALSESVAIHWGINNNPNGYFSKPAFVFGMPMIMVALQIFWVKNRDEKLVNKAVKISAYGLIICGILFILSILFEPLVSVAVLIGMILFCLFIYLYVYLKSRK